MSLTDRSILFSFIRMHLYTEFFGASNNVEQGDWKTFEKALNMTLKLNVSLSTNNNVQAT